MKTLHMMKILVALAAAMTCLAQSSTLSPTITTSSAAPATTQAATTATPTTSAPTVTTAAPPAPTSATTKPPASTTAPSTSSRTPTTPVIPITVKPGLTTPTIPPDAAAVISSIPTQLLPSSLDDLTQSLTGTTTLRPSSSSSNSSTNATSTDSSSSDSFFRIDNGVMWGAFAGATFIGAVVVVVLLRQSNHSNDDRSSSPYSPARTKHPGGSNNSGADKRPWQTPGVVQTLEPGGPPPALPVTVKTVPHAPPPPPHAYGPSTYSPVYHSTPARTPMAGVNRKQSAVPMLEPPSVASLAHDDDEGYDDHDRYSVESDDMNIRHTAPGDMRGGHHEWAAAAGMNPPQNRKVSVADSEGDIGDARMSYASTAMFERDSTATSRYSNSFTGGPPPVLHPQPVRLPIRDSYEL